MSEKLTNPERRAKAESLIAKYNEAYQNKDFNTAKELYDEAEELVNEYTADAKKTCFIALEATADPMLEACRMRTYPSIRIKSEKIGDDKATKTEVWSIVECEKKIDVLRLHKHCEGGIGHDKNWNAYVEKLNQCMTIRAAKRFISNKNGKLNRVVKEICDSYSMGKLAREVEMSIEDESGNTPDPTSNTQLLNALRMVISAMLGEEYAKKIKSKDVVVMADTYCKMGKKALTINVANHNNFRANIFEICHKLVTDKDWELGGYKLDNK